MGPNLGAAIAEFVSMGQTKVVRTISPRAGVNDVCVTFQEDGNQRGDRDLT